MYELILMEYKIELLKHGYIYFQLRLKRIYASKFRKHNPFSFLFQWGSLIIVASTDIKHAVQIILATATLCSIIE